MSMIKKIATAGAVAAMGLGLGAASASAYSISGGSYTGTATGDHTFTVGGAYTVTCPAALTTFSGTATGADNTDFTPFYGGDEDCEFFGFPATVTHTSGDWNIKVTGGPTGGWYTGEIHIPSGAVTDIYVPIVDCLVQVSGTQKFTHGTNGNIGRARNVAGGAELEAAVNDVSYTASANCPFSSGSDGTYSTNGVVSIPGVSVS